MASNLQSNGIGAEVYHAKKGDSEREKHIRLWHYQLTFLFDTGYLAHFVLRRKLRYSEDPFAAFFRLGAQCWGVLVVPWNNSAIQAWSRLLETWLKQLERFKLRFWCWRYFHDFSCFMWTRGNYFMKFYYPVHSSHFQETDREFAYTYQDSCWQSTISIKKSVSIDP